MGPNPIKSDEVVFKVNTRPRNAPRTEVQERTILIPKYVTEAELNTVLGRGTSEQGVQSDPWFSETREYEVEKIVPIIQERIIKVPRKEIEEIEIEVDPEEFARIILPYWTNSKKPSAQLHDEEDANLFTDLNPTLAGWKQSVQHKPVPVEMPITNYTPKLLPRMINRAVPIPVELELVIEYLVPMVKPIWREKPIPIPVIAERQIPVPTDILYSKQLNDIYLKVVQHAFLEPNLEKLYDLNVMETATADKMFHLSSIKNMRFKKAGIDHLEVDLAEKGVSSLKSLQHLANSRAMRDLPTMRHMKTQSSTDAQTFLGGLMEDDNLLTEGPGDKENW